MKKSRGYRCQFCGEDSPMREWGPDEEVCPKCHKRYDAMLAVCQAEIREGRR